jgi:predicted outer membrane repeat protein
VEPSAVIDGFTMAGGGGDVGGLVFLNGCSPTLSHCRFRNAIGGRGGSVYLQNSASLLFDNVFSDNSSSEVGGALAVFSCNGAVIRKCRFEDNVSTSAGGAIFLNESNSIRIANCVFIENQSGNHGGAVLVQVGSAQIDSCLFARNSCPGNGGAVGGFLAQNTLMTRSTLVANSATGGGGVFSNQSSQMTVTRSIVVNSAGNGLQRETGGVLANSCNDSWNNTPANYDNVTPGQNSFSLDPLFCDASADNYALEVDSPCAEQNSPACGLIGAFPDNCAGIFIRVPDDHPSITFAMNAAQGGDTVAVATGKYLEHVTLKNNVKLLGGWRSDFAVRDPLAHPSVIDASGFLSVVVAQNSENRATVIDGFVITGGNLPGKIGGGIQCFDSSPTISNNFLLNNRAGR